MINYLKMILRQCVIKTDKSPSVHYSTPVQWFPLYTKQNQPVMGSNGKPAAIQVKLKYTINADDMNIRYYACYGVYCKGKSFANYNVVFAYYNHITHYMRYCDNILIYLER